jgi:hypothetical protein
MTRDEHMKWCKSRAIDEFDFYNTKSGLKEAIKNGIISMTSDINKHPETKSESLQALCMMQLLGNMIHSRSEFVNFINGFN